MIKVFFILMVTMFMAGIIYQATQFALPKLFEIRLVSDIVSLQAFFDRVWRSPGESAVLDRHRGYLVYTMSGSCSTSQAGSPTACR